MSYTSEKIAVIVKNRLNQTYFLPAIQREFVWDRDRIEQLFDSVLRGYPLSSFLFWDLRPSLTSEVQAYKFIVNFEKGKSENEFMPLSSVSNPTLILDGQQRLTSLILGLTGSYSYRPTRKSDKWIRQRLFLDLLKDPAEPVEEDDELGLRYGFKFRVGSDGIEDNHYWFQVGRVLAHEDRREFNTFSNSLASELPKTLSIGSRDTFITNLQELWDAIWSQPTISFYTETTESTEKVLDIFVRANAGGVKLEKSDLLLSMLTAHWGELNAREAIQNFVKQLNTELELKNHFEKDFVLKNCLVLSDLGVEYKIENFTAANLKTIYDKWESIKGATVRGIQLCNRFGLDKDTLTSSNAVIPLCYFAMKHPEIHFLDTNAKDVELMKALRLWLLRALLNKVFSGQSDRMLNGIREKLKESQQFPFAEIAEAITQRGRRAKFDDDSIENVLALDYGDPNSFLALSLLYPEYNWGSVQKHIDHIYPQELFKMQNDRFKKLPLDVRNRYREQMNSLANLQILRSTDNIVKSSEEPSKWIAKCPPDFVDRHLIPNDIDLSFENFPIFIEKREAKIRKAFSDLI